MKYLYLYALTLFVFLAIDFIWLNFIAKNLYAQKIGHLLAENPNLIAALIFYVVFIVGIIIFAVIPGYESKSLVKVILLASLFGFLTYSTYDLTNLATLKNWPLSITIIDLVWGTSISTVTAISSYYIATLLKI
ncbi:MAG: DUF2177 family protein [Candidatus Dojkabacteria bacterium]